MCDRVRLSMRGHRRRAQSQVDREGRKFGKSEGGAVWLAPARLSPYRFYQYLFKTTDADVARFLRQLTFLPLDAIADIEARMAAGAAGDYRANDAQRLLAAEVTRFVHGDDGLQVLELYRATADSVPIRPLARRS